jgi:GNAT superfamily N-acetyltransferase
MAMAISVRRALPDDARAIAEVQVAGWQAAYRGLVSDAFLDAFTVSARTARWTEILAQGSETYVTEGGFCSVIRPARDGSAPVELAALYIAPSRWRHGLGRALVDSALSREEDVTLWVFAENDRARGFYAALGFVDDDAQAVEPGTGVLEIRMRRAGTPPPA